MAASASSSLSVTPLNQTNKELEALPFIDKDCLIDDFEGDRDFLKTFTTLREDHKEGLGTDGMWESNLPYYCLPAVNVFPEIIHLCAQNYDLEHRAVNTPSGRILFYINADSINKMLQFDQTELLIPFSMRYLLEAGDKMTSEELQKVTRNYMRTECQPTGPPPYLHEHFNDSGRLLLDMIAYVLGYQNSKHVDQAMLVLLSAYSPRQPPAQKYNFAKFIANRIHDQLSKLDRQGVFRYSAYIYHLFMFYHSEAFPCYIRRLDNKGERRSVIFWTSVYHKITNSPYTYCEFVDQFVYPVSCMLMKSPPPRVSNEIKKALQLSKKYKIGDWYLYEHHTVFRVYGCELCPYRLPKYVPMRLFALEYYRQLIQSDLTHFHSSKKKAHLNFKNELGPFIMNKKEGWESADLILKDKYKLSYSFRWVPYDPQGFITARRNKYRLLGIKHCHYPHIEKYANLQEWQLDTLVESLTEEERMLKNMKELEKTIDLDYVPQVPFRPPHSVGEGTSVTRTAPQAPSTSAAAVDKGKGIMDAEHETLKEKAAPQLNNKLSSKMSCRGRNKQSS